MIPISNKLILRQVKARAIMPRTTTQDAAAFYAPYIPMKLVYNFNFSPKPVHTTFSHGRLAFQLNYGIDDESDEIVALAHTWVEKNVLPENYKMIGEIDYNDFTWQNAVIVFELENDAALFKLFWMT